MVAERKAKKPKKEKALAIVPREELSLAALAREFGPFIDGIQRQLAVGVDGNGNPELDAEAAALVKSELEGAVPERRDRFAGLLLRALSESAFLREQGKQRTEAARYRERFVEKALFGLQLYMQMEGIKEVQGFAYRFKLHKNPASVFILDEQRIPDEFMSYKPTPDKEKIKEALQAGREVPGATLRIESYHVEIK